MTHELPLTDSPSVSQISKNLTSACSPFPAMDDFEETLGRLIDNVATLQSTTGSEVPNRKTKALFPLVLEIRADLQTLHKHPKREHPLGDLAREVRNALETKEFNALLLAAYNWRSVLRPRKKQTVTTPPAVREISARANYGLSRSRVVPQQKKKPLKQKRKTKTGHRHDVALTAEQKAKARMYAQKFLRDLDTFFATSSGQAMRQLAAKKKEYVDIYKAGRRLPGSFGVRT